MAFSLYECARDRIYPPKDMHMSHIERTIHTGILSGIDTILSKEVRDLDKVILYLLIFLRLEWKYSLEFYNAKSRKQWPLNFIQNVKTPLHNWWLEYDRHRPHIMISIQLSTHT